MRSARGPLFDWLVPRALREPSTFWGAIVFGLLFYGVVFISTLMWLGAMPLARANVRELLTIFHFEALVANGLVLLLWGPSRLAQMISRERELDTLSALRLTGLTGTELAVGFVGGAMAVPLVLCAITLPIVLAGTGGLCGPLGPVRAYSVLLLLALVYHLAAGLLGLASKKAQNAGGTAVFGVLLLLGLGSPYAVPQAEALGLFGPWGAALTSLPKAGLAFELPVFGLDLPGEALQLPVLALAAMILLGALGRKLAGDRPTVLIGTPAALALAALGAAVLVFTFEPLRTLLGEVVFARLLVLALLVTPLAIEVPVRFMDLVRGATRRDSDDAPYPEERLVARRLLAAPTIIVAALAVMGLQMRSFADATWPLRLAVAGAVLVTAWAFVALGFQAARLWSRDRGAPLLMATVALVVLWVGPFVSAIGLRELGLGGAATELPRLINPLYALNLTCRARPAAGYDPVTLAVTCAMLHAFGAAGMAWLVRLGERRVTDVADSLVVLPADADDAPGTLERSCPRGHLYAAVWTTCPHCPGAVSSMR